MFGFAGLFKIYGIVKKFQDAPQVVNRYADKWEVHPNGEVDGQAVKVMEGSIVPTTNPLVIVTQFVFSDPSGQTFRAEGATAIRVPVIKKTIGEDAEYVDVDGTRYDNGTTGLKFGNMGLKITAKFTYRWTDANNVTHSAWFALRMPITQFLG